ncbi:MAG: C4-dicarboxylate TRAP transporter substrate-binding protein [Planctomycetaceae bacterium]|nr:C4-dicarboxylate TRAP transporter substrate-binding protein [Planctomycetaceae bacterium]
MKKVFVLCAVLAMCALSVPARAGQPVVEVNVGFGPTLDVPYGQGHTYWAKLVEEQSNGTIKLNLFPNDQLGSGKDQIEQAWMGDPVVHSTDTAMFADLGVPDIGILQAPYLCETWEQMEKLFASDWFKEQEKLLEEKGFKVIASNWRYGDRNTLTTKPVKSPKDMAGLKIRVPQSMIFVKAFEALGASATPLALGEVYTSLQQGVIDGLENPLGTIWGGKYHEVAKYLLLDAHMKTINIFVCGTAFWETLTPEQQDLLTRTAKEAGEYQNTILAEFETEILEQMKAEGVTVTPIDYDEFKAAVEAFYTYPEFSYWTPGLYEKIKKIIAE